METAVHMQESDHTATTLICLVQEVEAPKVSSKKAAAKKVEDVEEIDQAAVEAEPEPVKAESQDSKHKHGHKDSHHHAEPEDTEEYQPKSHKHHQHDKDLYEDKDSYEKPSDKKSYYEKRAEVKSEVESEEPKVAEPEADSKPAPTKTEPVPSKTEKKPSPAKTDKSETKKASSEPKKSAQSDIDNDSIAKQLIPGLPTEADMKAAAPKASEDAPPSLLGFAKKLGSVFSATPAANPLANPFGYIDPDALADAGLPPVKNVGQLMGALVRKQMSESLQPFRITILRGIRFL